MNSLGEQPAIVLLVSAGYLRNDPVQNWYCAWELAEAIRQLGENKRTVAQTLVVYKASDGFRFAQFNEAAFQLLKAMAAHFHGAYAAVDAADADSFAYYDEFRRRFVAATRPEMWNKFVAARGALGSAISYNSLPVAAGGEKDFAAVIREVEKATGKQAQA
jgi:hypothetical protein